MIRFKSKKLSILGPVAVLVMAGVAFGGARDEQAQRAAARAAAPEAPVVRTEACATAAAATAAIPAETQALLAELKAARSSGDLARADEIVTLLGASSSQPAQGVSAAFPTVKSAPPTQGGGSRYGGDVTAADEPTADAQPDMVAAASGTFYLAVASADSYDVDFYRSADGGENWSWFFGITSGTYDILDPAIAVPEVDEDYMYAVYEYNNQIQVLKVDLAALSYSFHNVWSNVLGCGRPRITTDNHDYELYYIYVAFVSGTLLKAGGDAYEVMVGRSRDKAVTWENLQSLYIPDFSDPTPRPDIAYGNDRVFAVWDEEVLGPSTEMDVYVSCSTNFGANWAPKVNVTVVTGFDCYDPRIAAIQEGDEVVAVYTKNYTTDTDVWCGYSTDGGANWSTNHTVATQVDIDEERPDICVSPAFGDFHVVYWTEYDIAYRHASMATPGTYSSAVVVNDNNCASLLYYPPTVAAHFGTGAAGIAWADFEDADYSILFDRADWTEVADPIPDIKINGADLPVLIQHTQDATVVMALDPGDMNGVMMDWWVFVERNASATWWARYVSAPRPTWTLSAAPIRFAAATLRPVPAYTILGPRTVPVGTYVFTFAVDANNGLYEGTYIDTGELTVY